MDKIESTLQGVNSELKEGASQAQQTIRREIDSLDDFEHLSHEISPLKEKAKEEINDLLGGLKAEPLARDVQGLINTGVEKAAAAANRITDDPLLSFDAVVSKADRPAEKTAKMDSNLLEMGDGFPDRREADDKLDKFLQEMGSFAAPKHQELPENLNKDATLDGFKSATQNFMDNERQVIQPKSASNEFLDRYSDSEPDDDADDFKPSKYEEFPKKVELPESAEAGEVKQDTYKDVQEFETELPKKEFVMPKPAAPAHFDLSQFDPIQRAPEPAKELPKEPAKEKIPEPIVPEVKAKTAEPVKEQTPPAKEKTPEPVKKQEPKKIIETKPKVAAIEAEAIFCKMGLGK